jgi:hypothetical protein
MPAFLLFNRAFQAGINPATTFNHTIFFTERTHIERAASLDLTGAGIVCFSIRLMARHTTTIPPFSEVTLIIRTSVNGYAGGAPAPPGNIQIFCGAGAPRSRIGRTRLPRGRCSHLPVRFFDSEVAKQGKQLGSRFLKLYS